MCSTKFMSDDLELKNIQYKRTFKLTGVEPSSETLALENDRLPAKNEPPLSNNFIGLCTSAGHLCTEEFVVATHAPSSCSISCNIGCSSVHSNTLSLVAKSVKYN